MLHDVLMGAVTLFSGVTTAVVITLGFKWGRWTGVVDTRLTHIEETLSRKVEA